MRLKRAELCIATSLIICLLANVSLAIAQTPKSGDQGYITLDDGIRLFYQKVGNGPKTIIIPNGQSMLKDFKRFAGRNYTLILYDLRSRGRSNRAVKIMEDGVHQEVEDLEEVRRHFNIEKSTLIGHSYLGLVVALYAMKYPMHVEQVIQIGAAQPQGNKEYPAHLRMTDPIAPEVNEKIASLVTSEPRMDPKEFCRQYFKIVSVFYVKNPADWEKVADACEYSNEWPKNLSKHISTNITPSLRAINVTKAEAAKATMNILTIQGTADRVVPYGAGRDWAFLLPQARLLTIEGGSHFPWIEAPEKVFGAIGKFLAGQWPDGIEQITHVDPTN